MDPLSHALRLLHPQNSISAGLDAGGRWGINFDAHKGIKFNAVRKGSCWLQVQGDDTQYALEKGDCFLLTSGRPFTLASDLSVERIEAHTIYDLARDGVAICNGGGDFELVGGRFIFPDNQASLIFGHLPLVALVKGGSGQASILHWALSQLVDELRAHDMGSSLLAEHLSHIMLVQILRLYLRQTPNGEIGWLSAIADRNLCQSINAMHDSPSRRWTVSQLADIAGMSRSTFAEKFKKYVKMSPIEYLTYWRMILAAQRLRSNQSNVAEIALSLGYESESAFSTAFKRALLKSPSDYRRNAASKSKQSSAGADKRELAAMNGHSLGDTSNHLIAR